MKICVKIRHSQYLGFADFSIEYLCELIQDNGHFYWQTMWNDKNIVSLKSCPTLHRTNVMNSLDWGPVCSSEIHHPDAIEWTLKGTAHQRFSFDKEEWHKALENFNENTG